MNISFSTLACPTWTMEQIIAAAQSYGYDGVEIRMLDGELLSADMPVEKRRQVRAAFGRSGLPIVCLGTSLTIAQPASEGRANQIREGKIFLDMAAEWSAPMIRVFGYPPEGTAQQEAVKYAVDFLVQLTDHARQTGVAVVLETHDCFCSSAVVAGIMRQTSAAQTGVIWDMMNTYSAGETIHESIENLGSRLRHVHIKDGRPAVKGGAYWDNMLLGEGQMPISDGITALWASGYQGWLSVEWEKKWHPELEEPEVALPHSIAFLRRLLNTIDAK